MILDSTVGRFDPSIGKASAHAKTAPVYRPSACYRRFAPRYGLLALALAALGGGPPSIAQAETPLELEDSVGQFLVISNERRAVEQEKTLKKYHSQGQNARKPAALEELQVSHNIAVLPQVGYDPQVGFIVGGEFSDINFGASNMNLDLLATQSTGGETEVDATWGTPHLFGSDWIGQVSARYQLRPTQSFYGLGNNNVGNDAISQHEHHLTSVLFTLAHELAPHWMVAGTLGYDRITIGHGDPQDGRPSTPDVFGKLPGLQGGYVNPVSLSLIYNTRRDLTRPEQGWKAVAKVQHVGPELGSDFNYTQFVGDVSYIQPIGSPDHLLALRVDGEYLTGSGDDLPFYEFASLGGFHSLEGFDPSRFLGQSRVFARAAYQTLLADFNFRDIWRVRLDGTVFVGAGRVFLDRSRLPGDLFAEEPSVAPGLSDKIQVSYGLGLHIALGEAIATRLDVGFSGENKGLVYLSFGNAF